MINEAAINAVKNGRKAVSQADLFEAVEVVLVGKEKKDRIMSQEERRIVSYHEVGHALVSALQKDAEPYRRLRLSQEHGRSWIRHADAGGREIPEYEEGTAGDACGNAGRTRGGRNRV